MTVNEMMLMVMYLDELIDKYSHYDDDIELVREYTILRSAYLEEIEVM